MIKNFLVHLATIFVSSIFISQTALSIVGAELSLGQKTAKVEQLTPLTSNVGTATGLATTIDAYVQPLATIPLNLGLYYSINSLTGRGNLDNKLEFSQNIGGLLVEASYPVSILTLILKGGYILTGSGLISSKASDESKAKTGIAESSFSKSKVSGYRITTGLAYAIMPMIETSFTYTATNETYSYESSKIVLSSDGSTTEGDLTNAPVNMTANGSILALGLRIKI